MLDEDLNPLELLNLVIIQVLELMLGRHRFHLTNDRKKGHVEPLQIFALLALKLEVDQVAKTCHLFNLGISLVLLANHAQQFPTRRRMTL